MNDAIEHFPVTLCCAHEDASVLRLLVVHLEREEGYKVRLIEGVEEDPYLLGSALDRQLGPCVVVACLSDALGPSQFRRIEGVFNARKGPKHWLETLFVEPDETLAMAESVGAVVIKIQAKQASEPTPKPKSASASASQSASMRDVVGLTQLSAVGTDAVPSPNPILAQTSAPSLATPAPIIAADESSANLGPAKPVAPAEPTPPAEPAASASQVSSASQTASASQVIEIRKNPAWVAPVLFLIFLAVAGTVILQLMQQDSGEGIARRGAPTLEGGADAGASGGTGAEAEAGPESGESSPPEDATETGGADAETGGADAETGAAQPATNEASLIVEAIEKGELRAVDLILIANTTKLSTWLDATNYCRARSINGVRGWRLPTLNELKTIRKARMVERDRYWSSTLALQVGTGTDHVYVLDLANQSIDPLPKEAMDVRVVCVREALSVGG